MRDIFGDCLGKLSLKVFDVVLLAGDKVVELIHFLVDDLKVSSLEGGCSLSLFLLLLLNADNLREDQLVVGEWLSGS